MSPSWLFFISLLSSLIIFTHSYTHCLDDQKSLLLQLKSELIFNSSYSEKLVLWNQTDECCKWRGVECDRGGHVISLQLDDEAISGGIGNSSTLFRFHYLENLNLAYNWFNFPHIPTGFHNLTSLTHLNLSYADFSGQVPVEISSLRKLLSLDISNYDWNFPRLFLEDPNLEMFLQNLTGLRELYLDGVDLSTADPSYFVNFSSLTTLSLRHCRLKGHFPEVIFQLPNLQILDLSGNYELSGTIPPFSPNGSLKSMFLSMSNFSGSIPTSIGNLKTLSSIDLSVCSFTGPIPSSFANLTQLVYVDLSDNFFTGSLPSWIWENTQLQYLNLSVNHFSDLQKPFHIPAYLYTLDLHSNQLHGDLHLHIPPRIGNLTSNLLLLSLANNSLSGSIPNSLCNAENLLFLDLGVNKLSGNIPSCLLENLDWLRVFNLGRNNISGHIPDNLPQHCGLQIFDLSDNTIDGNIPKSLKNCVELELINVGNNIIRDTFPCMLSSSLRVLVLHSNRFHGEVKCLKSWPKLQILDISSNNFSGSLESINFSSWTTMIHQSDPQFGLRFLGVGIYPGYLSAAVGITIKGLQLEIVKIWPDFTSIDFSCNNFGGEIPAAIGDLRLLYLLNLSHNSFNSTIPKTLGALSNLESLDISVNQLTGTIPEELARLTFLSFLNVSYNKLVGEIPNGHQFQTFPADSFKGNPGLYGFPLNISSDSSPPEHKKEAIRKREIEWEYVCAAFGYVVGLGSIVWLLVFCTSLREKYFDKIEDVVEERLYGISKRRRRARRIVRTQGRRS